MDVTDPIKLRFYTEIYEKQNKNIKLVEKFSPVIKEKFITGKFYSIYEPQISEAFPQEYLELIERRTEKIPKDIYLYKPPTINMEYGWFAKRLIPSSTDPRLHFPLRQTDIVKTEIKIQEIDKYLIKPKFAGKPFKTN